MFVHGCFWHFHRGCELATVPKTNTSFWLAKLRDNRRRDARKEALLRALGFRVFVVWQCEVRSSSSVVRLVQKLAHMQTVLA